MGEPHLLSAVDQAAAVRRGELTAVDLVEHHLERLARLDPRIGAFVTVTADLALDQARRADEAVRRGAMPDGSPLPPLLGVPTAIKDLNVVDGVPTGYGTAVSLEGDPADDAPPRRQDHVVTLMRRAGMVVLGKTTTPEFGLPCYTESDVSPPTRTPWAPGGGDDPGRTAGGSSGGAAAAVAAGIVPVAQGSDGGGSIRIPASCCGVFGFKPTRGRVSNGPTIGDLTGLGWNGPLTRTVEDAAVLLDVIAVPMPGDPGPQPAPPRPFAEAVRRPPAKLRVGRFSEPVIARTEVHPECLRAWEDASDLLTDLGHEVVDIRIPFQPRHVTLFERVWASSAAAIPIPSDQDHLLRPLTRWLRGNGGSVSATEYLGALAGMQALTRGVAEAVAGAGIDVLLSPTLAQPPPPVGSFTHGDDPAEDFARQKRFTPYTSLFNVTGQPAASLPLHWTDDGLPVGVMLAAGFGRDDLLLALGAQVEAARPWAGRRPPGFA